MMIIVPFAVLSLVCATAVAALVQTATNTANGAWALLPVIVIHAFATRAPAAMPSWLVFVAGMTVDFATQGPPGYWALVYLAGLLWIRLAIASSARGGLRRAAAALGTVLVVAVVQYLAGSLYLMRFASLASIVDTTVVIGVLIMSVEFILPNFPMDIRPGDAALPNLRRRG
jgi:hypothetical protein